MADDGSLTVSLSMKLSSVDQGGECVATDGRRSLPVEACSGYTLHFGMSNGPAIECMLPEVLGRLLATFACRKGVSAAAAEVCWSRKAGS